MPKLVNGGIVPALVTPLAADGSLLLSSVAPVVEKLIADGAAGFFVAGSTGEGWALTAPERRSLLEEVIRVVARRVVVIAHVGATASTEDSVKLAVHAAGAGADAVSSVAPGWPKGPDNEEDTFRHYAAIGGATSLPFYPYHMSGGAVGGREMRPAEFLERMKCVPHFAGIKFTSKDMYAFDHLITHKEQVCGNGPLNALSGPDEMVLAARVGGADGAIGTTYNVMCRTVVELYRAVDRGDIPRARELQQQVQRVITVAFDVCGYSIRVVEAFKQIMNWQGLNVGNMRKEAPGAAAGKPITAEEAARLKRELTEVVSRPGVVDDFGLLPNNKGDTVGFRSLDDIDGGDGGDPAAKRARTEDSTDSGGPAAVEAVRLSIRKCDWTPPQAPRADAGSFDFSRSFLTFRCDLAKKAATTMSDVPPFLLNNARIPIDCVMTVTERSSGRSERILLGGNCKTETVGVQEGVWMQPSADFVPVFSKDRFNNIKTYDRIGRAVRKSACCGASAGEVQPDRQSGSVAESFDSVRLEPRAVGGVRVATAQDVVARGLRNEPLMGRTEVSNQRYDCVLEYPFKTVNLNERDGVFQPDTGPVLFPNLDVELEQMVDNVELAFLAWNAYPGSATGTDGWAEFLVRAPTEAAPGVRVMHYSQSVRVRCTNTVLALPSP